MGDRLARGRACSEGGPHSTRKKHRPEQFDRGNLRKNGEAALHADRFDLGCFVEGQQTKMKR